jgi:hypothetical protein
MLCHAAWGGVSSLGDAEARDLSASSCAAGRLTVGQATGRPLAVFGSALVMRVNMKRASDSLRDCLFDAFANPGWEDPHDPHQLWPSARD